MRVQKGHNSLLINEWEMVIDPEYSKGLLWCHIHPEGPFYACIGTPLVCRVCKTELPEEVQALGQLQYIGMERDRNK